MSHGVTSCSERLLLEAVEQNVASIHRNVTHCDTPNWLCWIGKCCFSTQVMSTDKPLLELIETLMYLYAIEINGMCAVMNKGYRYNMSSSLI